MLVKLTEVSVVVYMISQSIQAPGLVLNYDLLEDSCHVTINNILLFYHVRQTDSIHNLTWKNTCCTATHSLLS